MLSNSAPPHPSYADGPGLATILHGDKNEARDKHPSPTCRLGVSCSENLGSMQSSNQPVDGAAPIATQHVSQMLRPHARRPGPTEPSEVYAVKRPWKFLSVGHSRIVVGRGGADGIWRSRLGVGKQFRRPTLLLGRGQLGRRGEQRSHGLAVRTALGLCTSTLSTRSSCRRPSCSRALLALDTAKKFEESPSAPQIEPHAHLQRRTTALRQMSEEELCARLFQHGRTFVASVAALDQFGRQ